MRYRTITAITDNTFFGHYVLNTYIFVEKFASYGINYIFMNELLIRQCSKGFWLHVEKTIEDVSYRTKKMCPFSNCS